MSSSSPPSDVKTEMSHSGGVKPMTISGRTVLEKQRLEGMTVEEREWRKKWLKDQVLTPREPILIPTDSPDLMNPIRRFYRKPLDVLFFKILPFKQEDKLIAQGLRYYTGKILMGIGILYMGFYYFKYNTRAWESHSGWKVVRSRSAVYPGDPGYPELPIQKKGDDYVDHGFKKSIFSGGVVDTPRTAAET